MRYKLSNESYDKKEGRKQEKGGGGGGWRVIHAIYDFGFSLW